MTTAEKISYVQAMIGTDSEATSALVTAYLSSAEDAIMTRLYPFGRNEESFFPKEYDVLQCELAVRKFLRRGGQGELSHNENGVSRSYGSVNDDDLLGEVMPFVKVMK